MISTTCEPEDDPDWRSKIVENLFQIESALISIQSEGRENTMGIINEKIINEKIGKIEGLVDEMSKNQSVNADSKVIAFMRERVKRMRTEAEQMGNPDGSINTSNIVARLGETREILSETGKKIEYLFKIIRRLNAYTILRYQLPEDTVASEIQTPRILFHLDAHGMDFLGNLGFSNGRH